MKKVSSIFFLLILSCGAAQAASVGVGVWKPRPSGTINDGNGEPLSLREDLGLRDDSLGVFSFRVGPVELGYTRIDMAGAGMSEDSGSGGLLDPLLDPAGFNEYGAIVDIDDVFARYLWRFAGESGIGASLRRIDGVMVVTRNGQSQQQPVDEWVPQLAANLHWAPVPAVGLRVAGDWIRRGDDELSEWRLEAGWSPWRLDLRTGFLQRRYRIHEGGLALRAKQSGPYFFAGLRF